MSVHFRWHRGTFAESIRTTVEVKTHEELADYIATELGLEIPAKRLTVDYYCVDPRIGGACYIVSVYRLGVMGFTDGPL